MARIGAGRTWVWPAVSFGGTKKGAGGSRALWGNGAEPEQEVGVADAGAGDADGGAGKEDLQLGRGGDAVGVDLHLNPPARAA